MGRKRLPTAIHELKGSFEKNPHRRNKSEPKASTKTPAVPASFRGIPVARAKWKQLCKWLTEMKMLSETDTDLMEAYCLNYARMMEAFKESSKALILQGKYGPIRNPLSLEYHKCADRLLKIMTEMGLTPSSRSSLTTGVLNEFDPFEEYMKKLHTQEGN